MKLNIGSGAAGPRGVNVFGEFESESAEWKHIDVCNDFLPDECYDVTHGIRETDGSVEVIWMGDFIEHLPRRCVTSLLWECHRVLALGGQLKISTPDMEAVMPRWLASGGLDPELNSLVYGQQGEDVGFNHEPDTHRCGFTMQSLGLKLFEAGFRSVSRCSYHGVWYELGVLATK